jgi:alpha-ribazole phosphatase/probable phosphoglycerate mutase
MALELVYETHAITTDNEAGIATGWLPGRLSERGCVSAAELGQRRRGDRIAAVYVSDLERAVETARIAFEGSHVPVIRDPRLRECNYGRLNGMPTARLEQKRALHIDDPWPEGESYQQVAARTGLLLDELLTQWDGSRILMIGHSANKWALDHLLLGMDLSELVTAGLAWQGGWEYVVPMGWSEGPPSELSARGRAVRPLRFRR